MTESVLDGTSQFALLALLLATVAYIRTVPYKQLMEKLDPLNQKSERSLEENAQLRNILRQTVVLDVVQIICALLGFLVVARIVVWGPVLDGLILWILFLSVLLMLVFHLKTNGRAIRKAIEKYPCNGK